MDAIIGYTGFVGLNLISKVDTNTEYYNSKNIQEITGRTFKTVYCAGLYAEKWKINKNPDEDLKHIRLLQSYLSTIKCDRFILISTVDVLDTSFSQSETSYDICYSKYSTHHYGINRRNMEIWCNDKFNNCYIIRLPALFGNGLKKNALYDMIHLNNIERLRRDWKFQWYNIEWLYSDIQYCIANNIHLINLVTEPIRLGTIQELFFPKLNISTDENDENNQYKISTNYKLHTIEDTLLSMSRYIRKNNNTENLLISEIGWNDKNADTMTYFLNKKGITNIETTPLRSDFRSDIYSVQSILYNSTIQIFDEPNKFVDIVANITNTIHPKIIILGSPKNRLWNGQDDNALFSRVGYALENTSSLLCVEHNSKLYGGNWMTTFRDVYNFVKTINHPNIKVNLDIGNLIMENEVIDYEIDISYIGHIQVSLPYLGKWDNTFSDHIYTTLNHVKNLGYNKKISFEMKEINDYLPILDVSKFIDLMNQL